MSTVKVLIVNVYRMCAPSRCNMLKSNEILVVGPGIPELFGSESVDVFSKETTVRPVYVLEKGHGNCAQLKPFGHKGWTMFGNSFAYTSDSRFSEAIRSLINTPNFRGAVPIHDWTEDPNFMTD